MKKIERLCDRLSGCDLGIVAKKVDELISAHNELLDTHTVKEPKGCVGHEGGVCEGHIVNNKVKVCSNHEGGSHFECKACIRAHILSHTVKEEKKEWVGGWGTGVNVEPSKEEPTTPEKKHGKGLCTTYHPDDCCTENPKCDFYESKKTATPEKKCSHPKFCECPCMRGNDFTPLPLGKNWKDGLKPQKL